MKQAIKTKEFERAYLFYGEERYLKEYYENQMIAVMTGHDGGLNGSDLMNVDVFDGKVDAEKIIDAASTLPFLSSHRFVIVKDSGLFNAGRKDDSEKIASFMTDIPETTVVLFSDDTIDKRLKPYKKIAETGHIVEFKTQNEAQLADWIINYCKKRGKDINRGSAVSMVREVSTSMSALAVEMEKLIAYKAGHNVISKTDIDAICSKSFETRVFSLVDAVVMKKTDTALDIYTNLILMKEQPVMILALIARQFRLMLQCILLRQTLTTGDIARELSLKEFMVNDYLRQSRNFSKEILMKAAKDCLETDVGIKTGLLNARVSVEMLIVKYSGGAIQHDM